MTRALEDREIFYGKKKLADGNPSAGLADVIYGGGNPQLMRSAEEWTWEAVAVEPPGPREEEGFGDDARPDDFGDAGGWGAEAVGDVQQQQ